MFLQRLPSCDVVFCVPGNTRISKSGNATCISDLDIYEGAAVISFCHKREAAALEGSKNVMKHLCDKYEIPTAKYKTFTDPYTVKLCIQEQRAPIVIKTDGLAAGKGVTVAMTLEQAYGVVDSMLVKGDFGSTGCYIIMEEFLEGEENLPKTISELGMGVQSQIPVAWAPTLQPLF